MALTAFEREREARIAQNKARIAALELNQAANDFNKCVKRRQPVKQARAPRQLAPRPVLEIRKSGRLANVEPKAYAENVIDKADSARNLRTFCASTEESYNEDHIKLLGDYTDEWVLFQDGYDESGNRIYDKTSGLTCHQCRQKTLGLRTTCSSCQSLKGVFCGDCLFMRYGENVKEASQNPGWVCPDCRGICNCSIHRIRKGWAPTGSLYRRALADGYKSVAHMLILSNQAKSKPAEEAPQLEQASKSADAELTNATEEEKNVNDKVEAAKTKEAPLLTAPTRRRSSRLHAGDSGPETGETKNAEKVQVSNPKLSDQPDKKSKAKDKQAKIFDEMNGNIVKTVQTAAKEVRKRARNGRPPIAPLSRVTRSRAVQVCA